jgi:hypothetical protein
MGRSEHQSAEVDVSVTGTGDFNRGAAAGDAADPAADYGDKEPADASYVADVAGKLDSVAEPREQWDGQSGFFSLKDDLLRRGTIHEGDAQYLIQVASDFTHPPDDERKAVIDLLRDRNVRITPAALKILADHFGIPLARPTPPDPHAHLPWDELMARPHELMGSFTVTAGVGGAIPEVAGGSDAERAALDDGIADLAARGDLQQLIDRLAEDSPPTSLDALNWIIAQKGSDATKAAWIAAGGRPGSVPDGFRFDPATWGYAPVDPAAGPAVVGDQAGQVLRGTGRPGADVCIVNFAETVGPSKEDWQNLPWIRATVDTTGHFSVPVPTMQESDPIRFCEIRQGGILGPWQTIRATGLPPRTRTPDVSPGGTLVHGDGTLSFPESRQVAEPGARLRFVNERSGEVTETTVGGEDGRLSPDFRLRGVLGDSFTVAAATPDGDFAAARPWVAERFEPPAMSGNPQLVPFSGPLFVDGVAPEDVRQHGAGDCYLLASLAAVAKARPDAIRDMVHDNGDGTYGVRLFRNGEHESPDTVEVDGRLYADPTTGEPLYAESGDAPDAPDRMEMWVAVVEKAYAQIHQGYEHIGSGGEPAAALAELLGVRTTEVPLDQIGADATFELVRSRPGDPMVAATGKDVNYDGTGILSPHAYTVLGAKETPAGRFVTLRNPWSHGVPAGEGHAPDDGVFDMPLADFVRLFRAIATTEK